MPFIIAVELKHEKIKLPSMTANNKLQAIGWREWVSLPQLGIPAIKTKVDTGARTSCIHTFKQEEFERDGAQWIRFWVHPLQKNTTQEVACEAEIIDKRYVRDSGGHREFRPVIKTLVSLGDRQWEVEITLSNRENMLFRMLLGRTAMLGKLAINPALSYTQGKPDEETLKHYYP